MAFIKIQHTFNHRSGLAKDGIVNSFYFQEVGGDNTGLVGLVQAVRGFYDDAHGTGTSSILTYLHSSAFIPARHTFKVYDMNAAKPRVPLLEDSTAPTVANSTSSNGLPHEVAVCLSYKSNPQSGFSAKRRRGRIYLGPMNINAIEESATTHVVRPHPGMINDIIESAKWMNGAADTVGYSWVGYSPTSDGLLSGTTEAGGVFPIDQISVDDAFDTQRRRGEARSVITSFSF